MGLIARLRQFFCAPFVEGESRTAESDGRFEAALAHARTLYEWDPDSPWANYLLGYRHLDAGRYADALPYLERAVMGWPGDARLWYAVGLCHDWLEQPRPAAAAYRRALALDPEWTEAWKSLGQSLYALGEYPAAEDALRRYCDAAPEDREAHDLLGYVLYRQGKYGQAFGHYEQARRLDPMDSRMDRNARLLYSRSARS